MILSKTYGRIVEKYTDKKVIKLNFTYAHQNFAKLVRKQKNYYFKKFWSP